jgi:hypothetical protein
MKIYKINSCDACPNLRQERYYTADSFEQVYEWTCKGTRIALVETFDDNPEIPAWCPLETYDNENLQDLTPECEDYICINCGRTYSSEEQIEQEYRSCSHPRAITNPLTHLYIRGIGQYWNCGPVIKDYPHKVTTRILEDGTLGKNVKVKCDDGTCIEVIRFKDAIIPEEYDFRVLQHYLEATNHENLP